MMKEVVKHTSFRYKLFLAILLALLILIFLFRYYLTVGTRPITLTVIGDGSPAPADLLDTFSNDPLDILYVEDNLLSLDQRDPQLIQYTRVRHLTPPSRQPYNLDGKGNFRDEFSGWVATFFENKRNGVFIEAGAHKGEEGSHTLFLEKELGWKGLLIECNPTVMPYLRSKHRKAWIADVCLSPTTNPAVLNFSNPTNWTYSGRLGKPWNLPVPTKWTFFDVQAIPLYSVLAAVGWREVDYFSFDIEGQELAVLRNFPFELVTFKVIVIEVMFYTPEEKMELDELLHKKGYLFVKNLQVDKIYVHESLRHLIPKI